MTASHRRALFVSIALAYVWSQAGGCSASNKGTSNGGVHIDGGLPEAGFDGSTSDQGSVGLPGLNPLCGEAMCLPDSPQSSPGDAGLVPPGTGGTATVGTGGTAAGGQGGDEGDGGEGAISGSGGVNDGSGGDDGSGAGAGGDDGGVSAGGAAGGPDQPIPVQGCRVKREGNMITSVWAPAGVGEVNGPCFSSADCKPGLGCVSQDNIGQCLPFCCAGNKSCTAEGTYCASRRLLERPLNSENELPSNELLVPVCVAAVACSLEQPYPCPDGLACQCEDKACMVVRSEGMTSCETPGEGLAGQLCPCAWGHVCSQTTETCVELCSTASDAKECSQGTCQAAAELPAGWGVCVGVPPIAR